MLDARNEVRVVLVGGPVLEANGQVVVARGPARRRATLAVAYLLLESGRAVPADELAEAVWTDGLPASWAASLRRLVADARQWLGAVGLDAAVVATHGAYRTDLVSPSAVDVLEAMASATPSKRVVELLRAPLLPGLDAPWLEVHRAALRQRLVAALEVVATDARVAGRPDEALVAANEAISIEPLRESAYRLAMSAHRDAGRVGSALRVYEECRRLLAEELGTAPSGPTVAAYQALLVGLAGEPDDLAALEPKGHTRTSGVAGAALAMQTVASRTAIATLEGRLAAIEHDPHPDPLERVEVLLELGRSRWALSGATDQLRRISLAAGEAAITLGSAEHLGEATALASTTTGIGEQDADTEDLCRRGLAAFGDNAPTRARVTSLLAELRHGEESVALSQEAVAIARRVGEPGLLLDALLVLDQSLAWSPDLDARLAVEAECERLLHHSPRWRTRPTFEPLTRLQRGDLDWFRAEADRMEDLGRQGTQWEPRFYGIAFRAVLAQLAGDLDEAFRLADALLEESREEINAVHSSAGLYLALTRDRGGVAELLPVIESMAAANPRISTFSAAVALGRAIVGDTPGADAVLDGLAATGFGAMPCDHIYLLTLGLLAEAVSVTGRPDHANALIDLLEPYAGQVCAGAHATVVLGTVDAFLGALACTTGDGDRAIESFRRADALERRLAAPLLQARSSAGLAAALARRGHPGDAAEAVALAATAERLAAAGDADGVREAVGRTLAAAG